MMLDSELEEILSASVSEHSRADGRGRPNAPSRKGAGSGRHKTKKPVSGRSILSFFGRDDNEEAVSAINPDDPKGLSRCQLCEADDLVLDVSASIKRCSNCDAVEYIVIDNERPAKRDVPRDSASFSFKRLSHFNEWLSQIQGKDHHSVPEHVILSVVCELKKHNVANASEVTQSQVRTVLKKIKLSRYYEHVPYIISRIKGVPEDRMPPQLEDKLRMMFRCIQIPFIRHSPASRKNFLSYGYVLHKLLQLLGEDRYINKVSLLKSRDKLRAQDSIWRKMCVDLDWEFVPSI